MSSIEISLSDATLARIAREAEELKTTPDQMVRSLLEELYGTAPGEIGREIESDPILHSMLSRSQDDIQEGRVHTHEEVMDWHHSHRE